MKARLVLIAALWTGCAATPITGRSPELERTDAVLRAWTGPSALQARVLIDEYGAPDEIRADSLTWRARGPWDRIEAWNAPVGTGLSETLQETVDYPLSAAAAAELARFDPRVVCDVPGGRLAARSDSEEKNFLLLNLADDIVNGRSTPAQARQAYAQILERSYAGKTSAYMKGLKFRFGGLNP